MGTNYYLMNKGCETCGHKEEGLHLGKSSFGWAFCFQYNGGTYYEDVEGMKEWLKDKQIENEYGEEVAHEDFWAMVERKQENMPHTMKEGIGRYGDRYGIIIKGYCFSDKYFS